MGFTLYANRFDTDDVVFRIAKLVATGSIAGCAASASDAVGKLAVPFAACYLGSLLVLLALYFRAWQHVHEARPTVGVYLLTVGLSAGLWAVSLVVPSPARYVLGDRRAGVCGWTGAGHATVGQGSAADRAPA